MSLPAKIAELGWFGAGGAVFDIETDDHGFYPPLDDDEAHRHWPAGFSTRWVEFTDDVAIDSILDGDWLGGESAEKTMVRVLAGREEWLPQRWAHGLDTVARVAR